MLVDPVLFFERDHDDDVFLGMPRQPVEDLPPILEMLKRIRAIDEVGDRGALVDRVDIGELEIRVQRPRQTEADLGNVATANNRIGKDALPHRQRVADGAAVIEDRESARPDLVDEPLWQFANAQFGKERRLQAAALGDPIVEKPLVPIVDRVDVARGKTVIHRWHPSRHGASQSPEPTAHVTAAAAGSADNWYKSIAPISSGVPLRAQMRNSKSGDSSPAKMVKINSNRCHPAVE